MKINLTLRNRPFYNILSGKKKWEGRIYKGKYKKVKIGDVFAFTNVEDKKERRVLEVKVKSLHVFSSFEEAFGLIDIKKTIPGHSLQQCLDIYHSYYPKETIKSGVVFFGIEMIRIQQKN